MSMTNKLAGHIAALCKACTEYNVIETGLEDYEKVFTSLALKTVRLFVITTELLL